MHEVLEIRRAVFRGAAGIDAVAAMLSKIIHLRIPRILTVALIAGAAWAGVAHAQSYPNRPIKIVVPFGPGSGTDFVARVIAEELQIELGGTVVVDNRPGASSTIGADIVAKSAPDGYTLLMGGSSTHSSSPSLFRKLPYDVEKDFQPIANLVETPFFLVVKADAPLRNLRELFTWLEANRNTASFAYGSPTTQIAGAAFVKRAGLAATPVPYKSNPQAMTDLLGGIVHFMFLDQSTALPQMKAGKIRALATATGRRLPDLPDLPTMAESGMPNFNIGSWVGLLAPAGIPAEAQNKLLAALTKIVEKRGVQEKLARGGHVVPPTSIEAFTRYMKAERNAWTEKIRDAGIQPE
jgi:tripartite-type tricarboxylate transporter receptor subunit TctC